MGNKPVRAQGAIEYLITYSWAILLIVAVIGLLYFYILIPMSIPPNTCTFITGVQCNNYYVGVNPSTPNVISVGLMVSNPQYYPIKDPVMTVSINNNNYTSNCTPQYINPGASFVCLTSIPNSFGKNLKTNVYIEDYNCGLSKYGEFNGTCGDPPQQIYKGVLDYALTAPSPQGFTGISITPEYASVKANGMRDAINVSFLFGGSKTEGITLNLSTNNGIARLDTGSAFTGSSGTATDYISSTTVGNVVITTTYLGYSANAIITFS